MSRMKAKKQSIKQEIERLKKECTRLTKEGNQFWKDRPCPVSETARRAQFDKLDHFGRQVAYRRIAILRLQLELLPREGTKRQTTRKQALRWEIWHRGMVLYVQNAGRHPGPEPKLPPGHSARTGRYER